MPTRRRFWSTSATWEGIPAHTRQSVTNLLPPWRNHHSRPSRQRSNACYTEYHEWQVPSPRIPSAEEGGWAVSNGCAVPSATPPTTRSAARAADLQASSASADGRPQRCTCPARPPFDNTGPVPHNSNDDNDGNSQHKSSTRRQVCADTSVACQDTHVKYRTLISTPNSRSGSDVAIWALSALLKCTNAATSTPARPDTHWFVPRHR